MRGLIRSAIAVWNRGHFAFYRGVFRDERILWDLDRWGLRIGTPQVLRRLGATIGENVTIERGLVIKNALNGSCRNLSIGADAWLGPNLVIDLAAPVEIGRESAIADGTIIATHFSVGHRPLARAFPHAVGAVRLGRGTCLGIGCLVMHGITIGECAMIGAGAVVREDVPPRAVVAGVPARILRSIAE